MTDGVGLDVEPFVCHCFLLIYAVCMSAILSICEFVVLFVVIGCYLGGLFALLAHNDGSDL